MARIPNNVLDKKKLNGKELYIKGLSIQSISDIVDISIATLNKWKVSYHWEDAKKLNNLSISELKDEILNTFNALKNGEKPNMSADDISKLASSFEKISDNKKQLAYMFEAFKMLSAELGEMVVKSKPKDRDFNLKALKHCRIAMDTLINKLYAETNND